MQTRIRIIKRGAATGRTPDATHLPTKSDRERERETVNTVKTWIVDWHERKHALQTAANSLISSIGARREPPTKRLSPELI